MDILQIPVEVLDRIIIREEMEGDRFTVRLQKSGVMLSGQADHVTISVDIERDSEEVINFFRPEATAVMKQYGVDSMELECVSIRDDDNYLFPGPVIILEGVRADLRGTPYDMSPDNLIVMAGYFGLVCVPQFDPPLALLEALHKRQNGPANAIRKRIRKFPSKYAVADFKPNYYACLGKFEEPEERSMKWPI